MAEAIVDDLKTVEIKKENGEYARGIAAILLGVLLQNRPIDGKALQDLVPLDDPAVTGLFTA